MSDLALVLSVCLTHTNVIFGICFFFVLVGICLLHKGCADFTDEVLPRHCWPPAGISAPPCCSSSIPAPLSGMLSPLTFALLLRCGVNGLPPLVARRQVRPGHPRLYPAVEVPRWGQRQGTVFQSLPGTLLITAYGRPGSPEPTSLASPGAVSVASSLVGTPSCPLTFHNLGTLSSPPGLAA